MIAVKTLAAIEEAVAKDQGAKYRELLGELMPLAADAYNPDEEGARTHLGASVIGRECARAIWYSFRWATNVRFDGRMIRLFNRGHLEEPRMLALLKLIGVNVFHQTEDGKQFRIGRGHRGHGGGSMDAVLFGVPDIPTEYVLGEFKTHNDKSFGKLKDDGLLKAKYEHFVQTQMYMADQKLPYALYMATNKNDDAIHAEIIKADPLQAQRFNTRSMMIIDATEPPPKIAKDDTDFRCRFCDHRPVCWLKAEPQRTCRSCKHAVILDAGTWGCKLHGTYLTKDMQLAACPKYGTIVP